MNLQKYIFIIAFSLLSPLWAKAQKPPTTDTLRSGVFWVAVTLDENGDTLRHMRLPPVFVEAKHIFKSRHARNRYTKLRRDVLKVLPYAKYAGKKYRQMEEQLKLARSEKEKKEIINVIEDDIKDNFEKDLRKLTITQGRILIKLIDRETGRTSYVLLQELKSKFTAFFWQSIARVFNNNLKDHYDPEEEREIEKIIRSVEVDRYYNYYYGTKNNI